MTLNAERIMTLYYLSAAYGSDDNDGTSPDRPWRTLGRLADVRLDPGDGIRLERGSTWNNEALHLHDGGTQGHPVTIDDYGDPTLPPPHIACDGAGLWHEDYGAPIGGAPHRHKGEISTALLLMDTSYVEVYDLELSNRRKPGETPAFNDRDARDRTGVAVIAQERGTVSHVTLERLHVHDVEGNIYDKHLANGGIYCNAHFPAERNPADAPVARFEHVRIAHNTVERTTRWGIAVGYTAYLAFIDRATPDGHGGFLNEFDYGDGRIDDNMLAHYGATDVIVEHNTVTRAGGDAITVMYCLRPVVRANTAKDAAWFIRDDVYMATDADRVAAAIWPWRCKDALFERNVACRTRNADRGNGDGQAWDADFGDGTVYRHNYSEGNSGGTVMFCNECAVRSVFEHNVAVGDHMGAIDIPHNPDATVRGNVFVLADGAHPLRLDRADGAAAVEGNIFVAKGGRPLATDWHPAGSHVAWRGNTYVGFATIPDDDREGTIMDG
ncbi:hypothetical protein [Bifidobacterium cuniculi]|uniref:Dockerin type I repeat-containing domain protein n=1 Tax=Bifidobacterium cuniculi TaxID=1688 RepID=A0A087AZH8_9BIFI|nr:hypothetical protein [Bifidobacterium cuniculi]KFI64178.1 dockerin type I repeat-containing domain protein [Bifidobacterium cuniculi]